MSTEIYEGNGAGELPNTRITNTSNAAQLADIHRDSAILSDVLAGAAAAEPPPSPAEADLANATLPNAPAAEEVPAPCGAEQAPPPEVLPSPVDAAEQESPAAPEDPAAPGDEPPPNHDDLPPGHPLLDSQPQVRPGVTNHTLRHNGISITTLGTNGVWGLKIPYFGFEGGEGGRYPVPSGNGGEFSRERRAVGEPKYKQAAGTPAHAYFSLGLAARLLQHRYLIITEGEFKALSLVEAGYPAVALGGFYNFKAAGELLPELRELYDWMLCQGNGCDAIYFLGDADTAVNAQFANAAIQFRKALVEADIHTEARLPRMPLAEMDAEKGIDDARAAMTAAGEFDTYIGEILGDAIVLDEEMTADILAKVLFERERGAVMQLCSSCPQDRKPKLLKKLAKLAGAMGALGAGDVEDVCVQTGLTPSPKRFQEIVKEEKKTLHAEMEEKKIKRPVEIYYSPDTNKNFVYRVGSDYTRVDRQGALDHLSKSGFSTKPGPGGSLSEAVLILTRAQAEPTSWCRPLAGKTAGVHLMNGKRILVTESATLIEPLLGTWPTIDQYLSAAFNYDPDQDPAVEKKARQAKQQRLVVLAWLSQAVRSLYGGGNFTPAPALVLCGRKRGGKSTFQRLVTEIFGGRQANPFAFMHGKTGNNGELAAAEHWVIDDDQESARFSDRLVMKSQIKKACVVPTTSFNGKHRDAENLESWRRLTISLKDDEESLRVLPDLSENFADKIVLVHFISVPGLGAATYGTWWSAMTRELPAFVNYLLHEHEIVGPDDAYGMLPYHDPEIVELISGNSQDSEFGRLIDHYVMANRTTVWQGTTHQLVDEFGDLKGRDQLKLIGCNSARNAGRCLASLVRETPARYQRLPMLNGIVRYRIQPLSRPSALPPSILAAANGPAAGLVMPANGTPPPEVAVL